MPSSEPPTRPVPVPPSSANDPDTDPSPQPAPGIATPVDAEAEIDASTLRFLSSSFRALFLPWLFRLCVFTACAKLVRFSSRYLFRCVGWLFAHFWTALGWLVRVLAWIALWGGLVATTVWCLAGLGGAAVYWGLKARPRWNRYKLEKPMRAQGAKRIAAYSTVWTVARFVLRFRATWATRLSFLIILGVEAYAFLQQRQRRPVFLTSSSVPPPRPAPSDAPPSTAASPAEPVPPRTSSTTEADPGSIPKEGGAGAKNDNADEDLAERWARQVREEMLRESLLRQGKRKAAAAGGAAPTAAEAEREDVEREDRE
ncbi:hypothetical protein JCM10908_000760 [Rhodotorula pacifica]|uniref:uncharacterized protein n=1 Tax=Rhodotorula pacifica TaxID=1495444 RepID=UPI003176E377